MRNWLVNFDMANIWAYPKVFVADFGRAEVADTNGWFHKRWNILYELEGIQQLLQHYYNTTLNKFPDYLTSAQCNALTLWEDGLRKLRVADGLGRERPSRDNRDPGPIIEACCVHLEELQIQAETAVALLPDQDRKISEWMAIYLATR